jgi:hypothetical protein
MIGVEAMGVGYKGCACTVVYGGVDISRGVVMVGRRGRIEDRRVCNGAREVRSEKGGETTWNRQGEMDEMLMDEIGERRKKRHLYKMRHPTMRKMQTKQI